MVRDYPRVCGGTAIPRASYARRGGLSPRVRGNRILPPGVDARHRTIPACAGEPWRRRSQQHRRRDYPRVCGGTTSAPVKLVALRGLSPRVRGNLLRLCASASSLRTIPACAGEPTDPLAACGTAWDYPRVCGGTAPGVLRLRSSCGLSPRVRGNRHSAVSRATVCGTIPACAGEPDAARPYAI